MNPSAEPMLQVTEKEILALITPTDDQRWLTVLQIAETGNLDGATHLLMKVLDDVVVRKPGASADVSEIIAYKNALVGEMVISSIGNIYAISQHMKPIGVDLFCKAADAGYYDMAYNAANGICENVKSTDDYRRAVEYYEIAIAGSEDPAIKGASLVNCAAIVRDGLITGKKDWPAAVAMYERAAQLGLVTGMYNAANVINWMYHEGDSSGITKAVHWLNKVIEHHESKKEFLHTESTEIVEDSYDNAKEMLGHFHIQAKFDGADYEFGLKTLLSCQLKTVKQLKNQEWYVEHGLTRRIMDLSAPIDRTPGNHWNYILSALEWRLTPVVQHPKLPIEIFDVLLDSGDELPFVVLDSMFLPGRHYLAFEAIRKLMGDMGYDRFFLVPKFALFKEENRRIRTAVMYSQHKRFVTCALSLRSKPEKLIEDAEDEMGFLDSESHSGSCVISIAINMLNEGVSISDGLNLGSMWAGLEDWCMPVLGKDSTADLSLVS